MFVCASGMAGRKRVGTEKVVYVMEVTDRSRLNDMNCFHKSS